MIQFMEMFGYSFNIPTPLRMPRRILLVTALTLSLLACNKQQEPLVQVETDVKTPPAPEEVMADSSSSASSVDVIEPSPYSRPVLTEGLQTMSGEPVTFQTGKLPVRIMKDESTAAEEIAFLFEQGPTCHPGTTADSFKTFSETFKDAKKITYSLEYTEPFGGGDTFEVTLIENKGPYTEERAFRESFARCASGGPAPFLLSKDWLVLTTNCPGAEDGCTKVKEAVEPTIRVR